MLGFMSHLLRFNIALLCFLSDLYVINKEVNQDKKSKKKTLNNNIKMTLGIEVCMERERNEKERDRQKQRFREIDSKTIAERDNLKV